MEGCAIPFFHPQAVEPLRKFILENGSPKTLKKGQYYKHADEQLTHLGLILSGLCYYIYETEATSYIFAVSRPGSIMGDATFLSPMNIPLQIYARRDTHLCVVSLEQVEDFCKKTREIFETVVANSILKFQSYVEGMLINSTRQPEDRLKFLMKSIIEWKGKTGGEWTAIDLKLSNEECGEIIHTSRITVNRIFNAWKESGLLKKEDGSVYVKKEIYQNIQL